MKRVHCQGNVKYVISPPLISCCKAYEGSSDNDSDGSFLLFLAKRRGKNKDWCKPRDNGKTDDQSTEDSSDDDSVSPPLISRNGDCYKESSSNHYSNYDSNPPLLILRNKASSDEDYSDDSSIGNSNKEEAQRYQTLTRSAPTRLGQLPGSHLVEPRVI
jgi:hypothetical protein